MNLLLALFKWLGHSALGQYMQKSVWAFAVALAALGGSLLLMHLGLLGFLRQIPIRKLASALFPVVLSSLIVMVVTGILMVSEEALKCYFSPAFRAKMLALGVAVVIYFPLLAIQAWATEDRIPWWFRAGATVSLLSWLTVGWPCDRFAVGAGHFVIVPAFNNMLNRQGLSAISLR